MSDTGSVKQWAPIGKDVRIKRGGKGAGRGVSEKQKNEIIELAVSQWMEMGLTKEEISTGIATINVESGFNPMAGDTKHFYGLGQFYVKTWERAVKDYNKKYHDNLKPALERQDLLSQIRVMGAYMKETIWPKAKELSRNPLLEDHSVQEVAYGLWHQGDSSKGIRVKDYLTKTSSDGYMNPASNVYGFFHSTYDLIHAKLLYRAEVDRTLVDGLANDVFNTLFPTETLMRDPGDYHRIWRIEPDGKTRGYFED